ncbi:MAG: signal peptidase I [Gammaproteobacteria bacterium]|nr:signal peptidase I [Gammaproteobacteria bacterium]
MKQIIWIVKSHKDIIVFLTLMIVFRSSIADINRVPTGSMLPTIMEGDRIIVNKIAYDLQLPIIGTKLVHMADPKRGDIVIFESSVSDQRLVKRIIGIPGDKVSMQANQLKINGKVLGYMINHVVDMPESKSLVSKEDLLGTDYEIWTSKTGSGRGNFAEVQVPEDNYLVLGDNRDNSIDSRYIGFVPRSEIIGRSNRLIMSLDAENYYLPRGDRLFKNL